MTDKNLHSCRRVAGAVQLLEGMIFFIVTLCGYLEIFALDFAQFVNSTELCQTGVETAPMHGCCLGINVR